MKKEKQLNLEFGKKLKSLLKQTNETQKTFAEKIGVSENSVFNWCKGENIDLANYVKVLHFFLDNSNCIDMPKLSTNDKVADLLIGQFQTSVVTVKEKYVKRLTESNDKLKEVKQLVIEVYGDVYSSSSATAKKLFTIVGKLDKVIKEINK